jgi:hypothetical protein
MPFEASLSQVRGKRGLLLAAGLLAAALGAGWAATFWLANTATPPQANTSKGFDRTLLNNLDLSTFQKRGTLLIGETTAPSGARLRLVLDARTHELIGMRVVETETAGK